MILCEEWRGWNSCLHLLDPCLLGCSFFCRLWVTAARAERRTYEEGVRQSMCKTSGIDHSKKSAMAYRQHNSNSNKSWALANAGMVEAIGTRRGCLPLGRKTTSKMVSKE